LKGVGITEVPKDLLKALTKPLETLFKSRLYRLHVLNAQWMIKLIWKFVKKVIDPLSVKKFVICDDQPIKELKKIIDHSCLERRFGGNLDDKTDNFFPP